MTKNEFSIKERHDPTEQDWLLSRKAFVRTLFLSGIAIQLPWLQSCGNQLEKEDFGNVSPLTITQFKIVRKVQSVLFPNDGNGPGALEINADQYLVWVLNDSLLDANENNFIIDRIKQFQQEAQKTFSTSFLDISDYEQEEFIKTVSKLEWGKKFLSRLLTLIFEALMVDPVYGGNTNKAGWQWLQHDPGQPRPSKEIIYPAILKKHEV